MTPQPQSITLESVKCAAREAYNARILTSQHAQEVDNGYAQGEYRCSIGAGLDQTTLDKIAGAGLNEDGLHSLCNAGIIEISDLDYDNTLEIQAAHDVWYQTEKQGVSTKERCQTAFLSLIGIADHDPD
jgi:hypothetical protein